MAIGAPDARDGAAERLELIEQSLGAGRPARQRLGGEVDRLELSRPLTVDNFEGVAAVPIRGGLRFYLLSDDNFQRIQRTLLVAFDWRP